MNLIKLMAGAAASSFILFSTLASAADIDSYSQKDMKKMSIFLSNFTEVGFNDFTKQELIDDPDKLVKFGFIHNEINNSNYVPVSTKCTGDEKKDDFCPQIFSIKFQYVRDSVKKYIGYTMESMVKTSNDSFIHSDMKNQKY